MSGYFITCDGNFDPWVYVVSTGFTVFKLFFFSLESHKMWPLVYRLLTNCSHTLGGLCSLCPESVALGEIVPDSKMWIKRKKRSLGLLVAINSHSEIWQSSLKSYSCCSTYKVFAHISYQSWNSLKWKFEVWGICLVHQEDLSLSPQQNLWIPFVRLSLEVLNF